MDDKNKVTLIEVAALISLGLAFGLVWHQIYVKPHDAAREEIMRCMEDLGGSSRSSYDICSHQYFDR